MKPSRLFDLLPQQLKKFPKPDALAYKQGGQWTSYSTEEVINIVNQMSIGLRKKGIEKGDRVAIISPNRPEWNFVDFALQQLGAISVPMYPTISVREFAFIFKDSGAKMVFVADADLYQKATSAANELPSPIPVYTFDSVPDAPRWLSVLTEGKGEDPKQLDPLKTDVSAEDLLTIIYTSGTTGNPKGVMLTHHNILSNAQAVADLFPMEGSQMRVLSFLPICHIFERTAVYAYLNVGASIYYAESMETIGENLKEIKPHFFTTVPRLLEKVYAKIVAKGMELTGVKRKLFFWALALGNEHDPARDQGWWYNTQLKLANKLIFSKWREALGGNIQMIVSGAAALQPRLARVFWAGGIPVCEAYGLTETSPGISFTRMDPERVRIGYVGELLEGIQVKIAPDGEILTKGPNLMKGYWGRPDLTAEVIDADGWFHTGDVGELAEGRFLRITDRKKEMFKTSGGKYIAPQVLENKIKESPLVEQVMVVGEGHRFPAALIVPNLDALRSWCEHKEIPYSTDSEMLRHPLVVEKFERDIEKYNEDFGQWERIKQFRILDKPWSIEGGELTPTLKLKRRRIMEQYQSLVESIYAEESSGQSERQKTPVA
ncbi:AMP-dependent synthetase/ligase [Cesiribacter andamanensis]|uniref:Long-chain-fatty-acid--CoA ligase FadD15 n=1 Tax=Cesiribacter andamanensis AMV16 TaxID=1279009 RepID=M7N332_9BACT|nr:long-chain fatty acid--CoA ligase [Cesiribacter andamanensis]EMR03098.1 Long-chain-fatty-acid--CoA ligase FadD15 [Cesiribacter andamanensis AMV16]